MDSKNYQEYLLKENIFRVLVDASPQPMGLYVGPDITVTLVNKAILKVWDKDESVLGKTFIEALPEMEGQPFMDILYNVYRTGEPYAAYEAPVKLFVNGRLQNFYFNFNYTPLTDNEGKVWGILNTATDVTELMISRQKLQESEERTRFALESAQLGTWDLDPVAEIVTWDKRCKMLYGFDDTDAEVHYNDVLKHIHPYDRAKVDTAVKNALSPNSGGNYDVEFRTIGAQDGLTRWLRCRGKAYFDDFGNCIRFAGTALDISNEVNSKTEQQRLLMLIDATSEFISLSDVNGFVTYVNAAGRRMLGLQESDIGKHNSHFVMPEEAPRLAAVRQTLLEKGIWSGDFLYRHFETGQAIPVSATTIAIKDDAGKKIGRATIARDISQELASKQALVDSERLLQTITSAAPTALWMADNKGLITYANKTWEDWTGQANHETMGTGWLSCILPEDREWAGQKFLMDLRAHRPYEAEFRMRHINGDIRWCQATGVPQHDKDGRLVGYVGACTDVTETIKIDIELQLKNSALNDQIKQFEFVTDFMPVQLWTAKPTGELDYVNQQAIDFFGQPVEQILGPDWLNNIHPEDREGCLQRWTAAIESGSDYQYEFRLIDANGNYKWHLTRALPFISEGKIVKWFGTNTDIDEQKQLQRQKDDFLGIASHELKTPVTSIKAYTQVLEAMLSREGEDKKAAMVAKMDNQINRLTNLIGDLLDVTKINSGKIQFNKIKFDFNTAVQETAQDLQHTTNKHIFVMDFAEDAGYINADKDRIGQVITNLISNAVKYSPQANRIVLSTRRSGNEILLSVQDFGIGIPGDKLNKVFEQFYRVSGTKQHTFPGLGLGLYISNEIIRREGGKMWVNSVEGKGSTFCFSLPVIADD